MHPAFIDIKLVASIKIKIFAMLGMQTLILQLLVSLYFAYAFSMINEYNSYIAALTCLVYPLLIGSVKTIEK